MQIEWVNGNGRARVHEKEVTVAVEKKGDRNYTAIRFFNNSARKITDGNSIAVGLAVGRIYFKKGGNLRLSKYSSNALVVKIPGAKEQYVGEYNLVFDAEQKMWFIGA